MTPQRCYAVTFTAKEKAELLPVEPDSTPLGADEVAGRTLATIVSAGTEIAGGYTGENFPCCPGYSAVFEVTEVGGDVSDIAVGARLFAMGSHRSFQRCRAQDVLGVPDGLAPEQAVFARMMGVTMSTLTTTVARPPAKVLVTGLGLVGLLGAKVFEACGYDVVACDPVAERRRMAQESGLADVRESVPLDDPTVAGQVPLVLECSGHEQAVLDACNVVCKRGEVVLVATPWQRRTDLYAHAITHAIFHNYVVMRSGWEWEVPRQASDFHPNSIHGNFAGALRWLADGRVNVDSLYELVPPRDAQRVYQDRLHLRNQRLAAVFDWTDCP